MLKFKDALEEAMQGGLYIHLKYDQDSGQSMMRPMEPEHINTIRLALRIAQAVTDELSEGMIDAANKSMYMMPVTGEAKNETLKVGFRAMIEQMMREIGDE